MLPQKTDNLDPLPLSDRSLIADDKKNKKLAAISTIQKFDDFECT